ncbi:MAG: phosphoribosylformylglycinamidine cyclo-ligase [Myxococcota bacterium]|jgi:phosphoribosylformylglycinamidine cyclo-ligase|nr:phosphoribosylformylglycinamidine cyclo-ligase [Myxococcota bacterium]
MSEKSPQDAYAKAGVNIEAGNEVVRRIKSAVASTTRPEVIGGLGGFGGLFKLGKYANPVLVSGADGVGTKLLVAERVGRHDTVGIDLVAMSVNDILTLGAEPLFFLDYFATGKLDPDVTVQVVEGIAKGCRESGCALLGGETAEMPGMYAPGHYDLAGFAVGVVEAGQILDGSAIQAGDKLVGLASSGIHSNGFSLVRKLLGNHDWSQDYGMGRPLGEVLLEPTRLYVDAVLPHLAKLKGLVHITGGGFIENLPRILPEGLGMKIQRNSWPMQPIFELLAEEGQLSEQELFTTFNMGIGMVAVVSPEDADAFEDGHLIGEVAHGQGVEFLG